MYKSLVPVYTFYTCLGIYIHIQNQVLVLTVPLRTFLPSVFFLRTVVKDHSGDSLFSLLLDSLQTNTHIQLLAKLKISCFVINQEYKRSLLTTTVIRLPVRVFGAAVAVALLLPPPVPVDQLAEVGRLLTVFDDELVFEELLGRRTLKRQEWSLIIF